MRGVGSYKELAYYLCRPSMNVKIYEFNKEELVEINFNNIYVEMKKNNLTNFFKKFSNVLFPLHPSPRSAIQTFNG